MKLDFPGYKNHHQGRPAVVFGKGPSLDLRPPAPPGAITIGVNNVGEYVPVMYSLACDGLPVKPTGKIAHFSGVPASPQSKEGRQTPFVIHQGAIWFLHVPDPNREYPATRFTRSQVATTRYLTAASSSAQPAIHLAWYMGCTSLMLIGVDGKGGYAKTIGKEFGRSPSYRYASMKKDTMHVAYVLFGNAVTDLSN